MGKGDKKTRKGKITMGSFGVMRPRKKSATKAAAVAEPKAKKVAAPKKETAPKAKAAVKKVSAPKESTETKKTTKKEK